MNGFGVYKQIHIGYTFIYGCDSCDKYHRTQQLLQAIFELYYGYAAD
jgi:hypothetical protein